MKRKRSHVPPRPNLRRQRLLTQDPEANTRCESCDAVFDSGNVRCPVCGGEYLVRRMGCSTTPGGAA